MEEKIKVSVQENVYEILKKDCEDFRVQKSGGAANMNAFINSLLSNFYEEFSAAEEDLHDEIKTALAAVPEYYKQGAFENVVKVFAKKRQGSDEKKSSKVFSFKPTKNSQKAVFYIERILLQSESLSSFYRRLFTAYAQKTKTEREKIIRKENYNLLQKSIKKGVKCCIVLQSGEVIDNASVYSVAASKDELFNYVLLVNGKKNVTLRLSSVENVALLPAKSEIPDENATLFDRQIACAAQYPMYSTDDEPIKVRLTEKGQKLFKKIYLYRPTPASVEGDIYTFDCSANQLLYYFERFGDSAIILSPKKLGIFMRNYYYYAYKKYRDLYRKD